jgi:hypothetical protein
MLINASRRTIEGLGKRLGPFGLIGRRSRNFGSEPMSSQDNLKIETTNSTMRYPPARRSDHIDTYKSQSKGQVQVSDPYQWLEKQSEETNNWINAQVSLSRDYLDRIPHREDLVKEFTTNTDFEKVS